MKRTTVILATAASLAAIAAPAPASAQTTITDCGMTARGWSIWAGAKTSCPFARNVTRKLVSYQRHYGLHYGDRITVRAYSPATKAHYVMRCRVSSYLDEITCTGGASARVEVVR